MYPQMQLDRKTTPSMSTCEESVTVSQPDGSTVQVFKDLRLKIGSSQG